LGVRTLGRLAEAEKQGALVELLAITALLTGSRRAMAAHRQ
jgi:hypothetical protein